MASTYSTNLKIELMTAGENSGLWGGITNTNLGTALEEAIVGQGTANFATDADLTLVLSSSNASQVARAFVLNVTGALTATRNLIVPTINKPYVVRNNTSGGQSIVVKTSAGTGVTLPNGVSDMLYVDGTNVVKAFGYLAVSDIGVLVQAYDADLTAWAGKTAPTGVAVGTTDTQTLTNKTLAGVVLNDGYTEEVFAVTGTTPALSPTDGSIQTWTLSGNSTPTAGTWADGQSITLMVDDGTAATITWTSLAVTWKTNGGAAPTLNTTGYTAIALWKVGSVIYGARVGNA